jgi:hypothetical protein
LLDNQSEILIGDVKVPIIKDECVIYYPISFIMEKILLKKTNTVSLQKEYSQYIKKFKIDYGLHTGSTQNVNCISEEGLKQVLSNSKIGRLSIEQRKAMNVLLEYLHMDVISEDDRFLKKVSEEMLNKWNYNEYIRDCITYVLKIEPDIVWQKCTKCNNYYPYHINFFRENQHSGKEYPLYTVCRDCTWSNTRRKDFIEHNDKELRIIYNKYGMEIYKLYRDHKVLEIYNHWIANKSNNILPKVINNEEDKITIIKDCYDKGMFSEYLDLDLKAIQKVCKFGVKGKSIIKKVNLELFGVIFRNGEEVITNVESAKIAFNNYINKHNIILKDIYNYKYEPLIKSANLKGFMRRYGNNLLGFVMELYDNKYPAYKFKIPGFKYWDSKENRIRALKYFIEEDMKIQLEKVPLYITLTVLRDKGTSTMYNVCKKYYNSLFDWVNEVYPEKFDPKDFDIHYIRNNFDSIEEAEIHDILKKKFKYVMYNPNNTDRTIKIDGKVPDWFVFTKNKCYIVEYFGLLVDRETDNSRVNDYKERTEDKIEKYDRLDGYGKVYILPDDLKDNFGGLMEKLELIK